MEVSRELSKCANDFNYWVNSRWRLQKVRSIKFSAFDAPPELLAQFFGLIASRPLLLNDRSYRHLN